MAALMRRQQQHSQPALQAPAAAEGAHCGLAAGRHQHRCRSTSPDEAAAAAGQPHRFLLQLKELST